MSLAIPSAGIATICTWRALERKWRALTSRIQNLTFSLCFSSPPLSLPLPLLSFEWQATHRPRCANEAAAEHYHLPDMGQQKPKPYGYMDRGQSTILSHGDTQLSTARFKRAQMMWTSDTPLQKKQRSWKASKTLLRFFLIALALQHLKYM